MGKTKKCGCCAAVVIALIVILRIGVGWHFLYEGIWKTDPSNGFSSKGFLGMAKGPVKEFYYFFLPDLGGENRLQMAEVYRGQRDESGNVKSVVLHWSIEAMVKEARANIPGSNMEALMNAMLTYGDAAADYLGK